jgi:3-isopropylmalate dehydratase small subunit
MNKIQGRAHVYGDHIDTDRIIAGKYTKTLDLKSLSAHVLEDLDPEFVKKVQPGDLVVAGNNFGCGSSREQAPLALMYAGISAVIAASFARLFFRNAINIGLPVFEIRAHGIKNGSEIMINSESSVVFDLTAGKEYQAIAMPSVIAAISDNKGLIGYLKKHRQY